MYYILIPTNLLFDLIGTIKIIRKISIGLLTIKQSVCTFNFVALSVQVQVRFFCFVFLVFWLGFCAISLK